MVKTTRRNIAGAVTAAVAAVRGLRKRKSAPVMMKRRAIRRTRTATKTRNTRRRKTTPVVTDEYSKINVSLGSKPRQDVKNAWKYLNQNISKMRYGIRQYNTFGTLSGAMLMQNISANTSSASLVLPFHLWEVTACTNVVSGAVLVPNILNIPVLSSSVDTATLSWVSDQALQVEQTTSDVTNADSYPGGSSTLEYMSLRMICYPPLTIPCRWQIDILQFRDDRLIPQAASTPFATAAYQSYIKKFVKSPLEQGTTVYNKYLKVLHTETWIMTPKQTVDNLANVMREINIFKRFNTKMNYAWNEDDLMYMHTIDTQKNTSAAIKTQLEPRKRIFVSIRAQAANGTAWTQATMPSYDISLKMQHSQLAA